MSTAKVVFETIQVEKEVILTLNMREASALKILIGSLNGFTEGSIKELLNNVYWRLKEVGVKSPNDNKFKGYVYSNVGPTKDKDHYIEQCLEHARSAIKDIENIYPRA